MVMGDGVATGNVKRWEVEKEDIRRDAEDKPAVQSDENDWPE